MPQFRQEGTIQVTWFSTLRENKIDSQKTDQSAINRSVFFAVKNRYRV
ncbi:hypothetical protein KIS4809_5429 [Bacillus sp. ZZV12-4809]|nr:hypothetical protein KIS4809_5429 [Bacillus sp. ZZV12-4809]